MIHLSDQGGFLGNQHLFYYFRLLFFDRYFFLIV